MADVLLTHSNHLFSDPKQVRKMQPYPPLQTLIAAACVREHGRSVDLFDVTFDSPTDGFQAALDSAKPRLVAIVEDNFNFLTKMCLSQNREHAIGMIREARGRGLPVLVNGSDATDHPEAYLEAGATAILKGELETSLVDATNRLLNPAPAAAGTKATPNDLTKIQGLVLQNGAGPTSTSSRARIKDLDQLPFAAWDLVDIARYRRAWGRAHGRFSLNLVSSRGCPYRCNWCAKPIYGDQYQAHSAHKVAAEMALLKETYGADHIWFADDIFALSANWTREFANEVERLDARLPFKMQSRCGLMTREVVGDLARAGCEEVWMGAESGSQKVLDAMDKDLRVGEIGRARKNLANHGVRACYFLQFGYPGETWEDIQLTIEMVRRTRPDDIGVSVSYPLPGTLFYERVAADLGAKTNWSHSDDLTMMFQGAYPTQFYRALRDALHLEVETINGRSSGEGLTEHWTRIEELAEPAPLRSRL